MELFSEQSAIAFEMEELDTSAREIHERAKIRARKYLIAEAELLEAIMEVDHRRIFENFHYTHLTPYCVKELGLSEEVAACFVRVARKGSEVPELKEAVIDGRISVTKAKTIASVITPANQNDWIEKAATLSKHALESKIAEVNPKAGKPEKAKPVGQQKVRVEFELTVEEMELFRRAQELLGTGTLAETQVELLKSFLDRKDPVRKADRAKERKSPERSREHSVIPAVIKHAVYQRDRGKCQAKLPGGSVCGNKKWIHLHHIQPKSRGGPDTSENLITLCSAHHRQWHRGST